MKHFVGKQCEFILEGVGTPIKATVVGDRRDMILVKGEGEGVTRIVKSKVILFRPLDGEPEETTLLLLHCQNTGAGCPGVYYVKEGDGVRQSDFDVFMGPCRCRKDTCSAKSFGDLRCVEGKTLAAVFTGVMLGDYQESEK